MHMNYTSEMHLKCTKIIVFLNSDKENALNTNNTGCYLATKLL